MAAERPIQGLQSYRCGSRAANEGEGGPSGTAASKPQREVVAQLCDLPDNGIAQLLEAPEHVEACSIKTGVQPHSALLSLLPNEHKHWKHIVIERTREKL